MLKALSLRRNAATAMMCQAELDWCPYQEKHTLPQGQVLLRHVQDAWVFNDLTTGAETEPAETCSREGHEACLTSRQPLSPSDPPAMGALLGICMHDVPMLVKFARLIA